MTRAEANAEIAKRLGWTVRKEPNLPADRWSLISPLGSDGDTWYATERRAWEHCPDYFHSEPASRELVQWFSNQPLAVAIGEPCLPRKFIQALGDIFFADRKAKQVEHEAYLFWHLLATPEQVARAGCAALGIELEDEGK